MERVMISILLVIFIISSGDKACEIPPTETNIGPTTLFEGMSLEESMDIYIECTSFIS